MAEGCCIKLWCDECTVKQKAKEEKGKILLTGVAPAGLHSQQGIWALQSEHVPPSALGCAGLGQDGLGCKDHIFFCSCSLGVRCWASASQPCCRYWELL